MGDIVGIYQEASAALGENSVMGNPLTDLPRSITSGLIGTPPGLWGGKGALWRLGLVYEARQATEDLCLLRPSCTAVSPHTMGTMYMAHELLTVAPASPSCTLLFLLVFLSWWVPVKVVESPI